MTELKKVTNLAWRKFLMSPEGQEGMLYVREREPRILKGSHDEMIHDGGRVEGFKQALDTLTEIVAVTPVKEEKIDND